MKKLSVLFLSIFALFLVSCGQPTQEETNTEPTTEDKTPSIPRSQWDADNIAYTNTNAEPVTSSKWSLYQRQSGTNGIIGEYLLDVPETTNYGNTTIHYRYWFYETGYFKHSESGYSTAGKYYELTDEGTFVISKYNNDYFFLTLTDNDGDVHKFFYAVSNTAFERRYSIVVNGQTINAENL